jgi:type IV secretory pathway VirB4 component
MLITGGTGLEPFSLPLEVHGNRHILILGPTRTGKSTLLAAIVTAYTGIPQSRILWLDVDYSSFVLAHLLGAQYRDVGARDGLGLNPLSS